MVDVLHFNAAGSAVREPGASNAMPGYESVRSDFSGFNDVDPGTSWYSPDGTPKYPPNDGLVGNPITKTLQPGMLVDRYGGETGRYVAPQGTPYRNRSLPMGTDSKAYNVYEVVKPVDVQSGTTAPWFGEPGGGIQYQFSLPIKDLIEMGILRRMP